MLLAAGLAAPASAAVTYTTLDHPLAGRGGTIPYDLDGGTIVGTYFDAAGASHAFTYDGSTWTVLDHPLAAPPRGTTAFGISDGRIAGTFVNGAGQTFGYVYDGVTFTTLEQRSSTGGHADTFARGISGDTVVGHYIDALVARGFRYASGTFNDITVPGAIGVFPDDIDAGRIVGTIDDQLGTHAFVADGGTVTLIDHPLGEFLGTFGSGIDGASVIGNYLSLPTGASRGFLYENGAFTAINFPGATDTSANGIDGARIVGSYVDATGATHGFLAVVPEPSALFVALLVGTLLARRPTKEVPGRKHRRICGLTCPD
jgi:hypothetical protein